MHKPTKLVLAGIFLMTFVANAVASDLPRSDVGKEYSVVRKDLLRRGNVPLDQTHNPDRGCDGNDEACRMYPEISGCPVDVPLCRFEWKDRFNKRFYIIARGENPHDLIVEGYGFGLSPMQK